MKNRIEVEKITKDYGRGRGVFDVSFSVGEGEVFGFLGPNGAGKTTTIRQLMGFIRADKGSACIDGMDCFEKRADIQRHLGYLPGEIAFMEEMSGDEFLKFMAQMKEIKDLSRMNQLKECFELDGRGKIRRMSKGTKQKIGIICALMQSPEILLLDEPTSGLDPLMQNRFIDILLEEKKKGTTIFLSSHIFEEVERTCDRTAFIRSGELVSVSRMKDIQKSRKRIFEITFQKEEEKAEYLKKHKDAAPKRENVEISISRGMDEFIKELAGYEIADVRMRMQTLEEMFLHFYGGEDDE
ncbi:ATP-binding cassette domain-containing protein [Lacrimispora sp. NSJ-141]|uniref:ATP-binding cassette domain-containing protein n=1 Tax=Lientehia hominis TaxID=2897778 RepID=A0AAP2W969_9FIRM|nr:ATP-binding cassette domain-containing protein [Lientehia hominis]MCD2491379.1 ATP-binding cassette domain-containing protein [Lientehia hominis]